MSELSICDLCGHAFFLHQDICLFDATGKVLWVCPNCGSLTAPIPRHWLPDGDDDGQEPRQ
jgi:uncharacterized OB-fold protein